MLLGEELEHLWNYPLMTSFEKVFYLSIYEGT